MANIRIKDLSTTAAVTASDDFIAVDGATNGTRKLNAYSPTFGGNLTVSGTTGTIGNNSGFTWDLGSGNSFTALSTGRPTITAAVASGSNAGAAFSLLARGGGSRRTWNLETDTTEAGDCVLRQSTTEAGSTFTNALYFSAARNATLSGNLTVSGTGANTVTGATTLSTSINASGMLFLQPTGSGDYFGIVFLNRSSGANAASRRWQIANNYNSNGDLCFLQSTTSTGAATSLIATFATSGNFLLKSDGVDSGNGKLQLADHTSSTGGIGFGTDTSLYRPSAGNLALSNSTAGAGFSVINSTNGGQITAQSAGTPMFVLTDTTQALNEKIWGIRASSGSFIIGAWTDSYSAISNAIKIDRSAGTPSLVTITPNLSVSGSIAIGNTVQTAVAVASTHKVTISIGGVTYYLLATNV